MISRVYRGSAPRYWEDGLCYVLAKGHSVTEHDYTMSVYHDAFSVVEEIVIPAGARVHYTPGNARVTSRVEVS